MTYVRFASIIIVIAISSLACNQPADVATNQSQPANSPATTTRDVPQDEFAFARANFMKHCAVCHGAEGDGGRVEVEGKKLRVPSLKEGHALEHTDKQLVEQITEGDDEMPAFKDKLSAEEIDDLVRFVRKKFQGK